MTITSGDPAFRPDDDLLPVEIPAAMAPEAEDNHPILRPYTPPEPAKYTGVLPAARVKDGGWLPREIV